jgi:orotate phosphoribosyltransferase-like protein
MPQMSQVWRECVIGILTAGMSTRTVARELNVNFSTISYLQQRFREFGSTSNQPHNLRPHVWHCVARRFSDVNVVNRVPRGGGGVMVWAGISYGQ